MAKINREQLWEKVKEDANGVRDELFSHLDTAGALNFITNPVNRAAYLHSQIEANTPRARAWSDAFQPQYNINHSNKLDTITNHIPNAAKRPLAVGAATAATGLAGLVGSYFVEPEAAKEFVQQASNTALWMAPVTTALAYASNFVNDTKGRGKHLMTTVIPAAAALSIFGLLESQGIDSEHAKNTLEVASKAGLAATGIGTGLNLLKYHD